MAYEDFKDLIRRYLSNLAHMELISKFYEGLRLLLCVIDISSKYAWAIPLKDKTGITITNGCQKISNNLNENQTKHGQVEVVNFTIDQ